MLKSKEQDLLLKNIHQALKKGGSFSTFAYVLPTPKALSFKKKLRKYFSHVKTSPIIWNNLLCDVLRPSGIMVQYHLEAAQWMRTSLVSADDILVLCAGISY